MSVTPFTSRRSGACCIFEASITKKIFIMKKVTLCLAVLIFALSNTSCLKEEDFTSVAQEEELLGTIYSYDVMSGIVAQEIIVEGESDIYLFNQDFKVSYNAKVLKVDISLKLGGQLSIEANQEEDGSDWIISEITIENDASNPNRFEIDASDQTSLEMYDIRQEINEMNFKLIFTLQDLEEQRPVLMRVYFDGTYEE